MSDPSQDRICTRCHTRFTPRLGAVLAVGCWTAPVIVIGGHLVDLLVKPGPLLLAGICVASVPWIGWRFRRLAGDRERTCTTCGSRQTVPLLSPVGIDLHAHEARFGVGEEEDGRER